MPVSASTPPPAQVRVLDLAPGVRAIRLDNPARRNALGVRLCGELLSALAQASSDRVRVVLLGAEGEAFCAGADLKERAAMDLAARRAHNALIRDVTTQLAQAPFVAVAVLQGLALGGGLELALACDLRLAARGASLGLPECKVGTIPGAGGTQRLPRLIGTSRALALMLTGEAVDAAQALQMGLIHAVHPRGELDAAALELGNVLAARSPRALQAVRRLVREGTGMPLAAALEMEREAVGEMLASPDYAEGLAAFTQKRPPHFA